MIKSYSGTNQLSLKSMWFDIVSHLIDAGYELDVAYPDSGSGSPNFDSPQTSPNNQCLIYLLKPTVTVDPHFDTDPWLIYIDVREIRYNLNIVTPSQVITTTEPNNLRIAATGEDKVAGRLTLNNSNDDRDFFSRSSTNPTWPTVYTDNPDAVFAPISYRLTVTENGIVFYSWAEGFDRSGDCHNWFVIQRGVNKNGTPDDSIHRPLYCLFSTKGGGEGLGGDVNAIDPEGILFFVVRENDVSMPTVPRSAVMPTADTPMLINPIQQTATSEDGKFIMSLPEGMCTQRNKYDTQLDLIAYTSADVVAQSEEISQTLYGEASPRKYKAMNANYSNNKGMRIFILIQ
jgi:hypothetical protein